jgi:TRAP-type mannitol/chloroaromatic compound transport system permease large subunit
MAVSRKRLNMALLKQALVSTTRLSSFVMFILIGSTVFSFTFNAADGHVWVEHLFDSLPGGAMGFLIVVNVLVFILGMFIDFFEIAFIVIPMLAPVAAKILPELMPGVPVDALMIWFGVIIAMNLQTSFLTPPFGFALFYLRSVAARSDYKDRVTGETIPAVTTAQIYKGSIPFIVLQLIMVGVVIAFPSLVIDGLDSNAPKIDAEKALEQLQTGRDALQKLENEIPQGGERAPAHDPMKDLLEAIKQGEQKK